MREAAVVLFSVVLFSVVLFSVGLQQAFGTTIDFDTYPDGSVPALLDRITTEYSACGVREFTTTDSGGPHINNGVQFGKSPPNFLGGFGGSNNFRQPIGVEFSSPVESASIVALGVGCAGLILDGYNSANVLVDSDSVIGPSTGPNRSGNGQVDVLSIAAPDIVRLDIRQVHPTLVCEGVIDGYVIDDLEFPGPVCEASSQDEVIGGKIIPIEATSLLLSGMQTNLSILTSLVAVVAGAFGALYYTVKRKSENS